MGPRSIEYRESVYVGYRYFDTVNKPVMYPFGFGLSYTTFEYSDLKLSSNNIKEGEDLVATFKIKNIGDVDGAEIAQLYVADKESTIFRPKKELKGFKKVFLKVGEEKEVSLTLDSRAFSYYNVAINNWHIESGEFDILVGASCEDIKLSQTIMVESANPDAPIPDYTQSAPSYYAIANGKAINQIAGQEFQNLYGKDLIDNKPFTKGELTINNSLQQITCSGFGNFLYKMFVFGSKIVAIGTENPDMITNSVKDMPLRSLSGFTGGLLSQMTVDGVVDMCNGTKGGFKKFCAGFKKKNK